MFSWCILGFFLHTVPCTTAGVVFLAPFCRWRHGPSLGLIRPHSNPLPWPSGHSSRACWSSWRRCCTPWSRSGPARLLIHSCSLVSIVCIILTGYPIVNYPTVAPPSCNVANNLQVTSISAISFRSEVCYSTHANGPSGISFHFPIVLLCSTEGHHSCQCHAHCRWADCSIFFGKHQAGIS